MKWGDEVGVGFQSADRGSVELAMEGVTAGRACSQAKRRRRYLQGLVCEASEAWDRVPQCSSRLNVEVEVDGQEVWKVWGREFLAWRLRDGLADTRCWHTSEVSVHQTLEPTVMSLASVNN